MSSVPLESASAIPADAPGSLFNHTISPSCRRSGGPIGVTAPALRGSAGIAESAYPSSRIVPDGQRSPDRMSRKTVEIDCGKDRIPIEVPERAVVAESLKHLLHYRQTGHDRLDADRRFAVDPGRPPEHVDPDRRVNQIHREPRRGRRSGGTGSGRRASPPSRLPRDPSPRVPGYARLSPGGRTRRARDPPPSSTSARR